jgi:hypothetical protein
MSRLNYKIFNVLNFIAQKCTLDNTYCREQKILVVNVISKFG